ncbi:uncharacterized protein VTP21DRAFT_703 [Calcarisporiella thermophila]|uniref:uncharacterized protein n=1 Tax=Calcarisporiella thermophila TaxID=911321 RepID=UPI00374407A2
MSSRNKRPTSADETVFVFDEDDDDEEDFHHNNDHPRSSVHSAKEADEVPLLAADGSPAVKSQVSTPALILATEENGMQEDTSAEEVANNVHLFDSNWVKLPKDGGTILESFFNMSNSIIGAGIIGMPFAFSEAGFFMGIILLLLVTWVGDWTVRLLVFNGKLAGATTYQALLERCFGHAGLVAISIFQFAFAFGGMCAYCVIMGDTIPHVIVSLFPNIRTIPVLSLFASRRFVITFITILVSYPLSLYRDISKLAKASALALLAITVIVITVLIEGPRTPTELRGSGKGQWDFMHSQVFQAIGIMSFAFVCHHNIFLIYSSLKKPSLNRFGMVTHLSMLISFFACFTLAASGYLAFTEKTAANVLNNFPSDNFLINIARFCFGLNMFTTLPLEAMVCREVIENYFFNGGPLSTTRHVAITTVLVLLPLIISLATCNLGLVLELTGGFSATALCFILPPLCYLKLASGKWWSPKKLPSVACVLFGIVVMILSTGLSVHKAISGKSEVRECPP